VAGGYLVHEYDEVINANQAFAFGHHVLDFDIKEGFGRDRVGELGGFARHKLFAVRGAKLRPVVVWALRFCEMSCCAPRVGLAERALGDDDVVVRAEGRGLAVDIAAPLVGPAVVGGRENLGAPAVEHGHGIVGELVDKVNLPGVVVAVAVGREGVGDADGLAHGHGHLVGGGAGPGTGRKR
nr:hypothetical protein [Tanacetum cinerariifolium]